MPLVKVIVDVMLIFCQVWKVKKAFKIQVFWKGGKPTFLVGSSTSKYI